MVDTHPTTASRAISCHSMVESWYACSMAPEEIISVVLQKIIQIQQMLRRLEVLEGQMARNQMPAGADDTAGPS